MWAVCAGCISFPLATVIDCTEFIELYLNILTLLTSFQLKPVGVNQIYIIVSTQPLILSLTAEATNGNFWLLQQFPFSVSRMSSFKEITMNGAKRSNS